MSSSRIPPKEITGLYGALVRIFAGWINGAPSLRVDVAGELDTAISVVVESGRITRIYAMRNPHKMGRLGERVTLSR